MTFAAQYAGECLSCDEDIKPGQPINSIGRGYVHAICPDAAPEQVKAVCPGCFLELPASGVCGVCE